MSDINKSFEILNIPPNTQYEEAKAAYRELASILHPDKHMHNERLRIRADEKFKQLLNAWNELETFYKNPSIYEKTKYEEQQRDKQQRKRAEAELKTEVARRAEAASREEAERKRFVQSQSYQLECPYCKHINNFPKGQSIESLMCRCGYFWNKAYEKMLKRKTKLKFARLWVIYVLLQVVLFKLIGGFAIIIMFFSTIILFLFSLIYYFDHDGWRTS